MSSAIKIMTPREVHESMLTGATGHLIDVRSPAEFSGGHAKWAKSLPLDGLNPQRLATLLSPQAGTGETIYLICESGMRAEQAAQQLLKQGLDNLTLVEGGTLAWRSKGLPVNRSTRLPSLESQTQIVIGTLLLVFMVKALLLHPLFYGFIVILGAGLITAGMTHQCMLTKLLARLPWNRSDMKGLNVTA